jgi:hypothetical protein
MTFSSDPHVKRAAVCLLVAVGGEILPPASWVALFLLPLSLLGAVRMLQLFVVRAIRSQPLSGAALAIVLLLGAWAESSRVVLGVPLWVRLLARSFIIPVEDWKQSHGIYPAMADNDPAFPAELKRGLQKAGLFCSYRPEGESYRVTCQGVAFTKCSYDGAKQTWYGWD